MKTYIVDISGLQKKAVAVLFLCMLSAMIIINYDIVSGLIAIGFFIAGGFFGRMVERQYLTNVKPCKGSFLERFSDIWHLIVWWCRTSVFCRKKIFALDSSDNSQYFSFMFFSHSYLIGGRII